MAPGIDENSEVSAGGVGPKKTREFDLGSRSETKMSVGANITDTGLPEIDAVVKQYASVRQVGPSTFPFESVKVDRCHPVIR